MKAESVFDIFMCLSEGEKNRFRLMAKNASKSEEGQKIDYERMHIIKSCLKIRRKL